MVTHNDRLRLMGRLGRDEITLEEAKIAMEGENKMVSAQTWSDLMEGKTRTPKQSKKFFISTICAATVLAASGWGIDGSNATDTEPCASVVVEPGQTLSMIARTHGLTVDQLAQWNAIEDIDLIHSGDNLCTEVPVYVAQVTERERAVQCADRAQPGALAFQASVIAAWPGLTNLGIYNCRDARGSSSLSTHAEGRAIDFGAPDCSVGEAQAIASELVARAGDLGISRVLVCELGWSVEGGWFTPSEKLQNLHNGVSAPTHIHVELSRQAAEVLTESYVTRSITTPVAS